MTAAPLIARVGTNGLRVRRNDPGSNTGGAPPRKITQGMTSGARRGENWILAQESADSGEPALCRMVLEQASRSNRREGQSSKVRPRSRAWRWTQAVHADRYLERARLNGSAQTA